MLRKIAFAGVLVAAAGGGQAAELKKVGVTLGSLGNPFFVSLANAAQGEAKKANSSVQVISVSADYDLGRQFTQMESFVAANTGLVLINAADPKAIEPAVKKVQAAGIKVVAVGDEAYGADAVVMTDNTQAGTLSCQYLADRIGHKGNVLIINGPQVSSVVARVKGCKTVLAQYPDIKILSDDQDAKGSRDGGLAVAQSLLTRFPHVDGIFSINDPTAIGADLAAKQLGRKEMIITSVDGAPDIVKALQSDTLVQASAAQEPRTMGVRGVQIGEDILNGKPPADRIVLIPSSLVTRDNAASYKGW